ncbi:hypothetical protein B0H21DRAFT_690826 [Amylocystis lapponica]|nr:hypothetical protein B0H21DRAFT_690826 [Amylocystis lapponica]
MFNFDFDIDDDPNDEFSSFVDNVTSSGRAVHNESIQNEEQCTELLLDDLLSALPPAISFSPLVIPLSSGLTVTLPRRDLFDARFQVISLEVSEDPSHAKDASGTQLDFLDAPSDLVPGVYEGGLKTWESSVDLVDHLHSIYGSDRATSLRGKRVLELGCGTAVPTLYLLHQLFSTEPTSDPSTIELHLQDYNDLVLRLLTLPNVLLAWYMSPASAAFRAAYRTDADTAHDPLPPPDPTQPGELPLTPALTAAFCASLETHRFALHLFAGSWRAFDLRRTGGRYDLVLTAETIYRMDSLPSLVDLLWRACVGGGASETLEDRVAAQLVLEPRYRCLVAAKRVYFGVGGGVAEFVRAVEEPCAGRGNGAVRTVWERKEGVARSVMSVVWDVGGQRA